MLDPTELTSEQLYAKESSARVQIMELQAIAEACWNERVRRDSIVVCTTGVGECPVHQLGSCAYPEKLRLVCKGAV